MICILKQDEDKNITGWIIAADINGAIIKATAAGEFSLASCLTDSMVILTEPGKYKLEDISNPFVNYTLLIGIG